MNPKNKEILIKALNGSKVKFINHHNFYMYLKGSTWMYKSTTCKQHEPAIKENIQRLMTEDLELVDEKDF